MNSMMESHFRVMETVESFEFPEIKFDDRFLYVVGCILQVAAAVVLTIRFKKAVKSTRSVTEELEFGDYTEKFSMVGKDSRQATVKLCSYYDKSIKVQKMLSKWVLYYFLVSSSIVLFRIARTTATGLFTRDFDLDLWLEDVSLMIPLGYSFVYFANIYTICSTTMTSGMGRKAGRFLAAFLIGWIFIYNRMYFTIFSAAKTTAYFTMMAVPGIQLGEKLSGPDNNSKKRVPKDQVTEHPLARVCEQFDQSQMSLAATFQTEFYMIYMYMSTKKFWGMKFSRPAYHIYVPKSAGANEVDSFIFRIEDGEKNKNTLADIYTSANAEDSEKQALLTDEMSEKSSYGDKPALSAFVSDLISETGAFSLQGHISA